MRIDPNLKALDGAQPDGVQGTTKDRGVSSAGSGTASQDSQQVGGGDTLQLSGTLGVVQQLKNDLENIPDIRSERVAALRQQIEQGTYHPSNEAVAGAMLSEVFGQGGRR